jgi:predicted ATPase
VPYFLCLLADTYRANGEVRAGLAVIGEAMTMIDRTGERCWESELCRLRGELNLITASREAAIANQRQALLTEAEEDFRAALACAGARGSKGLELRAAVSLARMQTDGSKTRPEAIALLEQLCDRFPERTATPDLRDATEILDAERLLARRG